MRIKFLIQYFTIHLIIMGILIRWVASSRDNFGEYQREINQKVIRGIHHRAQRFESLAPDNFW